MVITKANSIAVSKTRVPHPAEVISRRVNQFGRRLRTRAWTSAWLVASISFGLGLLIATGVDHTLALESNTRWSLFLSLFLPPTFALVWIGYRGSRQRLSFIWLADELERRVPRTSGFLRSAIELNDESSQRNGANAFKLRMQQQAAALVHPVSTRQLVSWRRQRQILAVAAAVLFLGVGLCFVPRFQLLPRITRLLTPWIERSPISLYRVVEITPDSSVEILPADETNRFSIEVIGPNAVENGVLEIRPAGNLETSRRQRTTLMPNATARPESQAFLRDSRSQLQAEVQSQPGRFEYRMQVADLETQWQALEFASRPTVQSFLATVAPPVYVTDTLPETISMQQDSITLLEGSRFSLTAECDQEIRSGYIIAVNKQLEGTNLGTPQVLTPPEHIGVLFNHSVENDQDFQLSVVSARTGLESQLGQAIHLKVIEDAAPSVRWSEPTQSIQIVQPETWFELQWNTIDEFPLAKWKIEKLDESGRWNPIIKTGDLRVSDGKRLANQSTGTSVEQSILYRSHSETFVNDSTVTLRLKVIDQKGNMAFSPPREFLFSKFQLEFASSPEMQLRHALAVRANQIVDDVNRVIEGKDRSNYISIEQNELSDEEINRANVMLNLFESGLTDIANQLSNLQPNASSSWAATETRLLAMATRVGKDSQFEMLLSAYQDLVHDVASQTIDSKNRLPSDVSRLNQALHQMRIWSERLARCAEASALDDSLAVALDATDQLILLLEQINGPDYTPQKKIEIFNRLLEKFSTLAFDEFGKRRMSNQQGWESISNLLDSQRLLAERLELNPQAESATRLIDSCIERLRASRHPTAWANMSQQIDNQFRGFVGRNGLLRQSIDTWINAQRNLTNKLDGRNRQPAQPLTSYEHTKLFETLESFRLATAADLHRDPAFQADIGLIQDAIERASERANQLTNDEKSMRDRDQESRERFDEILRATATLESFSNLQQAAYLYSNASQRESNPITLGDQKIRTTRLVELAYGFLEMANAGAQNSLVDEPFRRDLLATIRSEDVSTSLQAFVTRRLISGEPSIANISLTDIIEQISPLIDRLERFAIDARRRLRNDQQTLSDRASDLADSIRSHSAKETAEASPVSEAQPAENISSSRVAPQPSTTENAGPMESMTNRIRDLANDTTDAARQTSLRSAQSVEQAKSLLKVAEQLTTLSDSRLDDQSARRLDQLAQTLNQIEKSRDEQLAAAGTSPPYGSESNPQSQVINNNASQSQPTNSATTAAQPMPPQLANQNANRLFRDAERLAQLGEMTHSELRRRLENQLSRNDAMANEMQAISTKSRNQIANQLTESAQSQAKFSKSIRESDTASMIEETKLQQRLAQIRRTLQNEARSEMNLASAQLRRHGATDIAEKLSELAGQVSPDTTDASPGVRSSNDGNLSQTADESIQLVEHLLEEIKQQRTDLDQYPLADRDNKEREAVKRAAKQAERNWLQRIRNVAKNTEQQSRAAQRTAQQNAQKAQADVDQRQTQLDQLSKAPQSPENDEKIEQVDALLTQAEENRKRFQQRLNEATQKNNTARLERETADKLKSTVTQAEEPLRALTERILERQTQDLTSTLDELKTLASTLNSLTFQADRGRVAQLGDSQRSTQRDLLDAANELRRIAELESLQSSTIHKTPSRKETDELANAIERFTNSELNQLANQMTQKIDPLETGSRPNALSPEKTERILAGLDSAEKTLRDFSNNVSNEISRAVTTSPPPVLASAEPQFKPTSPNDTDVFGPEQLAEMLDSLSRLMADQANAGSTTPLSKPSQSSSQSTGKSTAANSPAANNSPASSSPDSPPAAIRQSQRNLARQLERIRSESGASGQPTPGQRSPAQQANLGRAQPGELTSGQSRSMQADSRAKSTTNLLTQPTATDGEPTQSSRNASGSQGNGSTDTDNGSPIAIVDIQGESDWGKLRKSTRNQTADVERERVPSEFQELSSAYLRGLAEIQRQRKQAPRKQRQE